MSEDNNLDKIIEAKTKVRLSKVVQAWILLDGQPFSLRDWPMHKAFYDGRDRRTLFMTSRQVAKSTTLANFMIAESSLIPFFSSMFVSPSKEQTVRFSNTRVGKTMRYSPIINNAFLHTDLADRVFHKQFTNGAEMVFTYGDDDADRLRGVSSDRNMYDEVQDMLYDPIITVGNETMSNSNYAYETYAGTPKTMENTIQFLWDLSTKTEWIMKCTGCGKYQYIRSEKSIGKHGPICLKCGKYLNPFQGAWIDTNLNKDRSSDQLKGFHLCQPMMPFNVPLAMQHRGQDMVDAAERRWKRIITKYEENPIAVFRNEVIGVSDAVGARMISKEELLKMCTNREPFDAPTTAQRSSISFTVAGVDWSGGGVAGVSRTVLWIWGWDAHEQRPVCVYYKVFPGKNPVHIVEEITKICLNWGVQLVCGDAGEGHLPNSELARNLGKHRVNQVQYGSQKMPMTWNGIDRYTLDRTTLIDSFFMEIKKERLAFLHESHMVQAFDDYLNLYEDITRVGKKVWQHSPQKPDDCLHAALFGWLALKITQNNLEFK